MDVATQGENLGKTEKSGKPSILKDKTHEAFRTFSCLKVVEEGHRRCPDVIDFILTICAPVDEEAVNRTKKGESKIPARKPKGSHWA